MIYAILTLIVFLFAIPAQAGFKEGADAVQRGDYQTAYREWLPLAQAGNQVAQYNLGFMYEHGNGVPINYAVALKWYEEAAKTGHRGAEFRIGVMYEEGKGVGKDTRLARQWYESAASKGNQLAMSALERMARGPSMNPAAIGCSGIVITNSRGVSVLDNKADCITADNTDQLNIKNNVTGRTALAQNSSRLTPADLSALQTTVRELCVHPDRKGSYMKIDGDLNVGATLRILNVNGEGKITRETWDGINQRLDQYKTDPRACAQSLLQILVPAMTGPR